MKNSTTASTSPSFSADHGSSRLSWSAACLGGRLRTARTLDQPPLSADAAAPARAVSSYCLGGPRNAVGPSSNAPALDGSGAGCEVSAASPPDIRCHGGGAAASGPGPGIGPGAGSGSGARGNGDGATRWGAAGGAGGASGVAAPGASASVPACSSGTAVTGTSAGAPGAGLGAGSRFWGSFSCAVGASDPVGSTGRSAVATSSACAGVDPFPPAVPPGSAVAAASEPFACCGAAACLSVGTRPVPSGSSPGLFVSFTRGDVSSGLVGGWLAKSAERLVVRVVLRVAGHREQRGTVAKVHQADPLRLPACLADLACRRADHPAGRGDRVQLVVDPDDERADQSATPAVVLEGQNTLPAPALHGIVLDRGALGVPT